MPKKLTFNLIRVGGETQSVDYHPIVYLRGSDTWRLALHREPVLAGKGQWLVSDPISGYRVCRVTATYKGVPVSSKDLTIAQARSAALIQLDLTVDRVGLDRFTRALSEASKGVKT
jgi:hypothetical protein